MNAGNNVMNSAGPLSYIAGRGIIQQLLLAFVLATVLYITLMATEILYKAFRSVSGTRVNVLPMTVNAENKPREFEQNPLAPKAVLLPASDNERTGVEFTYAFYLFVNPSSFRQEEGLLHIMHKGNPVPYPLLGPGVFLHSNTNTLRVYMNSSKTWNNYMDVENIPVKKWVHVAIVARNNAVEIYVNGNLSKKLNLGDGVIYQNFGNLYLFSQRPVVISPSMVPSLKDRNFQVFGTYSGNLSNLTYFTYAISYTELQSLVSMGPSRKTDTQVMDSPPYFEDQWWTTHYSNRV